MNRLEKIASALEVPVDYVIEEFVIGDKLYQSELFMVDDDDKITFYDYSSNILSN